MSNLSGPSEVSAKTMKASREAMTDWMGQGGSATNPFVAHSAGAVAAATALGLAAASQWTGAMMGLMQGMMGRSLEGVDLMGPFPGTRPASAFAEKAPAKAENAAAARKAAAPAKSETPARPAASAAVAKLKSDAEAAAEAAAEPVAVAQASPQAAPKAAPQAAPVVTAPAADHVPVAVEAIEPEDFRRPLEIEKPDAPDDLKLIGGIGPKLEQVLNGLGVWTFEQIAAWNPAEIAWVDDYLQFKGRIGRDDWVAQAAALARGGIEEYEKTFGKSPR